MPLRDLLPVPLRSRFTAEDAKTRAAPHRDVDDLARMPQPPRVTTTQDDDRPVAASERAPAQRD